MMVKEATSIRPTLNPELNLFYSYWICCVGQVQAIVAEDLGSPIERLFASFDEQPIASASLAQASYRPLIPSRRKLLLAP